MTRCKDCKNCGGIWWSKDRRLFYICEIGDMIEDIFADAEELDCDMYVNNNSHDDSTA